MIKRIHTGGPYGDEMNSYDIVLDKKYTIEEFIAEIIANYPKEWGEFKVTIFDRKNRLMSYKFRCEYHYGVVTKIHKDTTFPPYPDVEIISVNAQGGWSFMEYTIHAK